MVELPLARRDRARDRLDPRRARGHDRRLPSRRADRAGQRARALARRRSRTAQSIYVAGACLGALVLRPAHRPLRAQEAVHGHALRLPARHGRDRVLASALWFFALPASSPAPGIGGEYSAINSAIDELIPARAPRARRPDHQRLVLARRRGRRPALAAAPRRVDLRRSTSAGGSPSGWARCSASGSCSSAATCPRARAGCSSTAARRRPSGSSTRSRREVREETGQELERAGRLDHGPPAQVDPVPRDRRGPRSSSTRSARCSASRCSSARPSSTTRSPSASALILTDFLEVGVGRSASSIAVFAVGNFLGPLLLGRLFDTVGRRPMIAGTYLVSAALLVVARRAASTASCSATGA